MPSPKLTSVKSRPSDARRGRHTLDPDGYAYDDLQPMVQTCLEAGVAVLVRGHPGVGKSTLAAEIAVNMRLPLEDIRLAQRDPAEIGGVYFPSADRSELSLLPPPWVRRACREPTLIFLDEINAAVTRLHQAAAYQIVLERRVGPFRFHPGTVVLAAGNLEEDRAIVTPLSTALANRFAHFTLRADIATWLRWAERRDVAPQIIAYMRANEASGVAVLYNNDGDDAFATPRSWAMASEVLSRGEGGASRRLVASCIGLSAAQRFFSFLRTYELFHPEHVIERGAAMDFTKGACVEASFAIAAVTALGHYLVQNEARWQPAWAQHLVQFLRSPGLDVEYAFLLLRDLHARTDITERLKVDADYRRLAGEIVSMHATMLS